MGPLEPEKKWNERESKLINYSSTLIGVNGVPLYYVMRGKDNLDTNGDLPNFIENTIACATVKGDYYEADCHKFHQALVLLTTGHQL